ncbi:ABC transporter permease [Oceanobacillus bengalensis]|uniref:ABC transporter permease n=1 Tax=Oceanobacillus bengalensis TaxID=1435466 RepID=A0A494YZA8_9BACI|nr:ABC transporter permease [Oceanobacillus bengalensis]RKQ15560.1 ABC transporter permease [Oceanobacillus bengalensis]
MSFNQLILRNLKKNIKNYYLYVFALIFTVALYFAFVTLQYDPAMDEVEGSIKGAAAIRAGSVMLIAIVTVFLVYANNLFIKRRSKEIGLFQLVGMTKGKIFQILSMENLMLYFGSMIIGILMGFASSKLMMMILLKVIGINEVAELRFSGAAFVQTVIVFAAIYVVIMLMNAFFIKKQRILSLFQVRSTTEGKRQRITALEVIIGILGLALIGFGYFLSTKLFSGDLVGMNELFMAMFAILGSVIFGTYLFYRGSISFIFNLIRKKNAGYLSINKVLSLSSIMFRMKSNSLLLTVITTLSALAIGLLSLTYISYYSAQKLSEETVLDDFSIPNLEHAALFTDALEKNDIGYSKTEMDLLTVNANISNLITGYDEMNLAFDPGMTTMVVVTDEWVDDVDLSENESVFVNSNEVMEQFLSLKNSGEMMLSGKDEDAIELNYIGIEEKKILPTRLAGGGFYVAVVDDDIYQQLAEDKDPSIQGDFSVYVGVNIDKSGDVEEANNIFQELDLSKWAGYESQLETFNNQKQNMGMIMFIVGFLGLTFLVTSGCILYFKQMDEGEEEKANYTILRKLGFTRDDLVAGVKVKQLFNFGIPLLTGLCHSYFAVKSGWFLFGTELWAPMIIVMVLYTVLYSIFGVLSVLYYKKVIKEAL